MIWMDDKSVGKIDENKMFENTSDFPERRPTQVSILQRDRGTNER